MPVSALFIGDGRLSALSVTGPVLSAPSETVTASAPTAQIQGQTLEIYNDKAIKKAPIKTREISSQTIVPVIPETFTQPPKISETPKAPDIIEIDPRLFLDKFVEDVAVVLGPADFVRIEGKVGVWQYRQAECVIDFFFYLESADTPSIQRIAALDIRNVLSASLWMKKIAAKRLSAQTLPSLSL